MRPAFMSRLTLGLVGLSLVSAHAERPKAVTEWLTTADRSSLLAKQASPLTLSRSAPGQGSMIVIDDAERFQAVDGFGFALTGGSAQLLMKMDAAKRRVLLQELFGHGASAINVSYLRVSVGASDMNDHVFTYDDMPSGQTDPQLKHFSLRPDEADVIPVLREILSISPSIKILASPWTAPSWMKTVEGPHTDAGGCPVCQGAITLDGDTVERNIAYYAIAQVSKFVPPASIRIASTEPADGSLPNVAFRTPDGHTVLLIANTSAEPKRINVAWHHQTFQSSLSAGSVATYVW